jgi:hypothetical protein
MDGVGGDGGGIAGPFEAPSTTTALVCTGPWPRCGKHAMCDGGAAVLSYSYGENGSASWLIPGNGGVQKPRGRSIVWFLYSGNTQIDVVAIQYEPAFVSNSALSNSLGSDRYGLMRLCGGLGTARRVN